MSDNKKEVLNGYEQLKRKNRRRLVGASALVVVASGLFASALSGSDEPEQNVVVATASAPSNTADEDAHAKELAEAAVLEPTSDGDTATDSVDENEKATKQLVKVQDQEEESHPVKAEPVKPTKEESDMGPPLVIINDKLVDSDIKGLEESERIQKAEVAKREAAERRAKERQQRLAAQREAAAKKRAAIAKAERDDKARTEERVEPKRVEKAKVETKETVVKAKSVDKAKSDAKVKSDVPKVKTEDKKVVKSTDTDSKKESTKKADKKSDTADKKSDAKAKSSDKNSDKAKKDSQTSSNKDKAKTKADSKATIQAGYVDKFKAHQLAKDMNSAGINARVIEVPTDKGTIYRVKTGTYPNRKAADYALGKLRQKGVGGTIVDE